MKIYIYFLFLLIYLLIIPVEGSNIPNQYSCHYCKVSPAFSQRLTPAVAIYVDAWSGRYSQDAGTSGARTSPVQNHHLMKTHLAWVPWPKRHFPRTPEGFIRRTSTLCSLEGAGLSWDKGRMGLPAEAVSPAHPGK